MFLAMPPGPKFDAAIEAIVFNNPGTFVDEVKINDRWFKGTTWVPDSEMSSWPRLPLGYHVGVMPRHFSSDTDTALGLLSAVGADNYRIVFKYSTYTVYVEDAYDPVARAPVGIGIGKTLAHAFSLAIVELLYERKRQGK